MPRNRVKHTESAKTEPVVPVKEPSIEKNVTEQTDEKPKKPSRKPHVLSLYSQLYSLRASLRVIDPKIAKTTDRCIASIAYPARFLAHVFNNKELLLLSDTIGDYRTLSRVISTPAVIEYALDLILDNKNPDTLDRYSEYISAISGLGYQILEDIAYLASKNIIHISAKRQADLWIASDLFWAVDVALEVVKYPYHKYVLRKPASVRKLFVNLAWLPLTYHWATYAGVFNNGVVGFLGTCAQWPNMWYQWKTA